MNQAQMNSSHFRQASIDNRESTTARRSFKAAMSIDNVWYKSRLRLEDSGRLPAVARAKWISWIHENKNMFLPFSVACQSFSDNGSRPTCSDMAIVGY